MADDTRPGHIVSLEGGIADVRFPGALPEIGTALVTLSDPETTLEVMSLPGGEIGGIL